jgi:CDP-paratose 2-epimerase
VETTALCAEITGNRLEIAGTPDNRPGDVPVYISDCSRLFEMAPWRPRRDARQVLADTFEWIQTHEDALRSAL